MRAILGQGMGGRLTVLAAALGVLGGEWTVFGPVSQICIGPTMYGTGGVSGALQCYSSSVFAQQGVFLGSFLAVAALLVGAVPLLLRRSPWGLTLWGLAIIGFFFLSFGVGFFLLPAALGSILAGLLSRGRRSQRIA